jgi:hypothetical protein
MPAVEPQDRVPNVWYELSPSYGGTATIHFNGQPIIEGNATYSFDNAAGTIEFVCSDAENSRRLDDILENGQPGVVLPAGPRPDSITVQGEDGTFIADFRIFLTGHSTTIGGAANSTARFRAIGSTFTVGNPGAASHFVLPLYNMLSPTFTTWPRPQRADVDGHQLRIFPTPGDLPAGANEQEQLNRNWHNRLIVFEMDGRLGFIEALPDYAQRSAALTSGREGALVTAMLVCDAATRECHAGDPHSWFPLDLLNVLSLASGLRVGAPWIEYRDAQGRLVRRVHRDFGKPQFKAGHAILAEAEQPNTGYLLTQAFQYVDLSTATTRLLINHLINAGIYKQSVDERFLSLFRAFEALAIEQGAARTNLRANLDQANSQAVQARLDACWTDLRNIAAGVVDPQRGVIQRIADRARGADQQDVMFGLAVSEVARTLGFQDGAVLNGGFTATTGEGWPAFLSHLRGDIVHQGGVDLLGGGYDTQEVVRVADHLHDLLTRIVLRRLTSQAPYASPLFPAHMLREVDWVQATTPASQLVVV